MTMRYLQNALLLIVFMLTAQAQTVTNRASNTRGPDVYQGEYARVLDEQLPLMADEDVAVRQAARYVIDSLCSRAGAPGDEDRRLALCQEIAKRLTPATNKPARVWLLRKLAELGHGEVVATLEILLRDDDAQIRELSRRALQTNPDPMAGVALRDALAASEDPAWRVALINAIGARGNLRDVKLLAPLCLDADETVVRAAIAALADIAAGDAIPELTILFESGGPEMRPAVADACVRAAFAAAEHSPTQAARALNAVYSSDVDERLRAAALRGLVKVRGDDMFETLAELVRGTDTYMSVVAAGLADTLVGHGTAERLTALLRGATPQAQVALLDALAERREPSAHEPAVHLLGSQEQAVRLAAAMALEKLGGADTVPAIVAYATTGDDDDRAAADACLRALRGEQVNAAIAAELRGSDPGIRPLLIGVLLARQAKNEVPAMFAVVDYADEQGQRAALDALGELAADADLAKLLDIMLAAQADAVRDAAQNAVVKICQREPDAEQHAQPVLHRLAEVHEESQPVLLRTLGRLRGEAALAAVRAARDSDNGDVRDAAVRALCDWKDPVVLEDLFVIAAANASTAHRVLAFRAIVQILRQPAGTPDERLANWRRAMELADEPDMKKQALSTLATIPSVAALQEAQRYLEDADLRAEARAAVIALSRAIAARHTEEAMAALEPLRADATEDELARINETTEIARQCRVYCMDWLVSPFYVLKGHTGLDLVDDALPPETADADVKWQPLALTNDKQPWEFDLNSVAQQTECCIYVRTRIWMEHATKARLRAGSDDGLKIWLNGVVVHTAKVARGLTCGSDTVDVDLNQGWNTLMLKITQGNGGWGFCCGIMTLDDKPVDGLRFAAE
ncbi:MAG: HEAT repeat domain-containing protein [Phycisphaerae bacterium]|nr:HEAT repeat domain-containing protein [Phycisphaerae bacterium]